MVSERKVNKFIPLILIVIGIVLTIVPFVFNFSYQTVSTNTNDWGSFGDYVGGVLGVLISSIAVYLIWETYMLQKEELTKTSESLEFQNTTQIFFKILERKDHLVERTSLKGQQGLGFYAFVTNHAEQAYDGRKDIPDNCRIIESLNTVTDHHSKPVCHRYLNIIVALANLLDHNKYSRLSISQKSNLNRLISVFNDYLTREEREFLSFFIWWKQYKEARKFLLQYDIIPNILESKN